MAKDVTAFCLCPGSLLKAKLKSNRLISLREEISIQFNIDFATWLIVIILKQAYNVNEQMGQRETQNAQFEEKRGMKKFTVRTKACSERGRIKERLDLKWYGGGDPQDKTLYF